LYIKQELIKIGLVQNNEIEYLMQFLLSMFVHHFFNFFIIPNSKANASYKIPPQRIFPPFMVLCTFVKNEAFLQFTTLKVYSREKKTIEKTYS